MQLFPRDGHRLAVLQISHTARDLFIPSRLNGSVALFETVEQGVSQCAALVHWQRKRAFQEIGDLWTHDVILPWFRSAGCRKSPAAVAGNTRPARLPEVTSQEVTRPLTVARVCALKNPSTSENIRTRGPAQSPFR